MAHVGANNLTITDLEVHLETSTNATVGVWFRQGSYVGNEGSSSGWTLLGNVDIPSATELTRTPVDITDQQFLANTTYAFAIFSENDRLYYTNAPGPAGSDAVSDGNLTIENGLGSMFGPDNGFGGDTFTPRQWNGTIIYVMGPSSQEEITQMIAAVGGAARVVVVDAAGVARDLGQVSIATRDGTTGFVRAADGSVTLSTSGAAGLTGNLYTWAELTTFRSTENGGGDAVTGGSGVQIGADFAIGPDMVAGLSLGYSEINASDGPFSQEGEFVFLQPYFSYRSGPWQGSASLIYGQGSFNQTSIGGSGSADVTLTAATFEGGYDFDIGGGFTATPTLGLVHGMQEIEGTGGTLTGSETLRFSQASLGGRVTLGGGDGTLFTGLHLDYLTQDSGVVLADNLLSENGWSGRFELGGSTSLNNGLELDTSLELSGLGSGADTISGGLRFAFRF